MTMTITNGSTAASIATSISNAGNFRSAIGAGTGNGTVTSVTGTVNQISVATGTTTPVISIPSTFIAPGTIQSSSTISIGTGTAG
jgi:hypothetical protein